MPKAERHKRSRKDRDPEITIPTTSIGTKKCKRSEVMPAGRVQEPTGAPRPTRSHQPTRAHQPTGAQQPTRAHQSTGAHQPTRAHQPTGAHQPTRARQPTGAHQPTRAPQPTRPHRPTRSNQPTPLKPPSDSIKRSQVQPSNSPPRIPKKTKVPTPNQLLRGSFQYPTAKPSSPTRRIQLSSQPLETSRVQLSNQLVTSGPLYSPANLNHPRPFQDPSRSPYQSKTSTNPSQSQLSSLGSLILSDGLSESKSQESNQPSSYSSHPSHPQPSNQPLRSSSTFRYAETFAHPSPVRGSAEPCQKQPASHHRPPQNVTTSDRPQPIPTKFPTPSRPQIRAPVVDSTTYSNRISESQTQFQPANTTRETPRPKSKAPGYRTGVGRQPRVPGQISLQNGCSPGLF